MAVPVTQMDGYARSLKIALGGKSDEARSGASMMVQAVLRYAHGLKREDQTFEAMVGLLERLARELPMAVQQTRAQ